MKKNLDTFFYRINTPVSGAPEPIRISTEFQQHDKDRKCGRLGDYSKEVQSAHERRARRTYH